MQNRNVWGSCYSYTGIFCPPHEYIGILRQVLDFLISLQLIVYFQINRTQKSYSRNYSHVSLCETICDIKSVHNRQDWISKS